MLLRDLVDASAAVASTRSRVRKAEVIAQVLRRCDPDEVATAASWLSGVLPQRRVGVGWRGLADLPAPAVQPSLSLADTDTALSALAAVAGSGSATTRSAALRDLFGSATVEEQHWLRRLITGEMRQGALDGVSLQAIALAADVPESAVRRAVMLAGHAGPVAAAALTGGTAALAAIGLEVGRPVRPMLAASAPDVPAAVGQAGTDGATVVDGKLDGIRVQAHRLGDEVRVFTRSLDDITERVPEVVEAALALDGRVLVLDGEAIALGDAGRPLPFQDTAARTMSSKDVEELRRQVPLSVFFFDLLHHEGEDLIDQPARERFSRLEAVVPPRLLVPRLWAEHPDAAQGFFDELVSAGHEGVVVKDADAPYAAGRRGAGWVKVKPRHTLDLVVLAVEWGRGRRQGLLSNIHLGARDPQTGGFVMLGKTFKGMTDAMLAWQTERFLGLETGRSGHVVHVRPEQVVEIAFDGVQRSSRYPGGMALRFARVLRYRDDKSAEEADTVETVRAVAGRT
ncbi:ATP-dependent DNA ligase [Knoellia sp. 3-2P3]|uniref:ATP-dependent DNA ligase n=1 Tax=unclassified Knoellia TaxID=2618719 RepID=UPI0023DA9C1B|nr:ATP-dependent DNA ligase [Knoellia sp. 3-2P3]MDF2091974.1 ATP-dependent DNA ligase [Knoellia sp. 3-2P3]